MTTQIGIRLNEEDRQQLQELADHETGGNLSEMVRKLTREARNTRLHASLDARLAAIREDELRRMAGEQFQATMAAQNERIRQALLAGSTTVGPPNHDLLAGYEPDQPALFELPRLAIDPHNVIPEDTAVLVGDDGTCTAVRFTTEAVDAERQLLSRPPFHDDEAGSVDG